MNINTMSRYVEPGQPLVFGSVFINLYSSFIQFLPGGGI